MSGPARDDSSGNVAAIARREFLLRWGRRALCAGAIALMSFGAYRGYQTLRRDHLTKQAVDFYSRGDFPGAVLVARHVLQLDEQNLPATWLMAEMAEQAGNPGAIYWRQRVHQLRPHSSEDRLALVTTAMRFGQTDLARTVLNAAPETERGSAEFQQLAGGVALASGRNAAAEIFFAEVLRQRPADERAQLNLSTVRLTASDPRVRAAARIALDGLRSKPAVRLEALRALASDALSRRENELARELTEELRAESGAAFSDKLLYLEAWLGTEPAAVELTRLQTEAGHSARAAADLIAWMNRHEMAAAALKWAQTIQQELTQALPLPLAIAESYSFLEDWPGLARWVNGKNWGPQEALRLAVESHAVRRQQNDSGSVEASLLWRQALKAAGNRSDLLAAIAQLAEGWGYQTEAEDAWWTIANGQRNAPAALAALQRHYRAQQNTRGLLRVARRALEINPNDLTAANNCAGLGLLLGGDGAARRMAAKLYAQNPANAASVSTYAFALFTEGKTHEGLAVLEGLKDGQLQNPVLAAYHFILLVDDGQLDRARACRALAERAALLPEERQLVTDAARKIAAGVGHENEVAHL
jgi:hypothetical protein